MKLLDVMKKYDRCVVRESAKLTKIYNLLLKESEEADNIEEAEVCPDCREDPCVCESGKEVNATEEVNEDDSNVMTAEEFFAEAEKAAKEEETNECSESEEVTSEAEETENDVSAEEFFKESETDDDEEEKKANDDIDETEEMMSAEEFFAESDEEGEINEQEKQSDEQKKDIEEADEEEEEKKLEESLKSYRRANHRLFNN